jgi:hypothetical protein
MPVDDLRTMGRNAVTLYREYRPEKSASFVLDSLSVVAPHARETR